VVVADVAVIVITAVGPKLTAVFLSVAKTL
jgi:hypothetical protein